MDNVAQIWSEIRELVAQISCAVNTDSLAQKSDQSSVIWNAASLRMALPWAWCDDCGHDYFVANSCKGRGVCPSCDTRRMVETAAHLVDHAFPRLPVRHWVRRPPAFWVTDDKRLSNPLRRPIESAPGKHWDQWLTSPSFTPQPLSGHTMCARPIEATTSESHQKRRRKPHSKFECTGAIFTFEPS